MFYLEICTKLTCRYGDCEIFKDSYVCHCVDVSMILNINDNYLLVFVFNFRELKAEIVTNY